jgi:copper ion binding protein
MVSTYKVTGMTCGHCVSAVSTEVAKIDGVTNVDVRLEAGEVDVTSDTGLDATAVQAAVEEAGFELVS